MKDLNTSQITSVAYGTSITDMSIINIIKHKNKDAKLYSTLEDTNQLHKTGELEYEQRRIEQNSKSVIRKQEEVWPISKKYSDTSTLYRRSRLHLGLWSRIKRNSKGSLPKEIDFISNEQIEYADSLSIKSYTTANRSIRKCCLTVFTACAKMASRSLGCFENCKKYPYSCKSIPLSVKELSKPTHAGTDTMGRKNDPVVQKKVIQQLRSTFKKPTSYNFFFKNQSVIITKEMMNIFSLPELIFHRFQATYDKISQRCTEKSRIVWCIPYFIVALENIFFGKIIESTKLNAKRSRIAVFPIGLTNYEIGQKSVRTLRESFDILGNKNYKIYSLDFSKFDQTVPNWTKDLFFSLFKINIDMNQIEEKIYDYLRIYIKFTPFIYKDKLMYKEKGISSGLLITNLFDTWFQLTIHYFVCIVQELYPELVKVILSELTSFDKLDMDKERVRKEVLVSEPLVRVMGDDAILLCDTHTLALFQSVCKMLGMTVKVKHTCNHPNDDIFFLGRFWNKQNRPTQSEEYIALRIVYTKWYDQKKIPFSLEKLHLYRILSVCLPLIGGKQFLDKYLFDYEPYVEFKNSDEGFIYMKDFIEEQFKFYDRDHLFQVDSY